MKKIALIIPLMLLLLAGEAMAETIHTDGAIEYSGVLHDAYKSSSPRALRISSEDAALEANAARTLMLYYDGELSDDSAAYDICDEYGIHTLIYNSRDEADKAFAYYTENNYAVCRDEVLSISSDYLSWGPEYIGTPLFTAGLRATYGSKKMPEITVAVVDTGVDYNHSFLKGRINTNDDYDFYNNDDNAMDDNDHGTHVAGIIADNTPSNVTILPIKVANSLGSLTTSDLKLGMQHAIDKGVDVMNMSLAADSEDSTRAQRSTFLPLFTTARQNGITICVAAGNADKYGNVHNANYIFPAYMDNTIVVANLVNDGSISNSSNYGTVIDISAPGTHIYSTVCNNRYAAMGGTSMASPFAAAAAALLLTRTPALTPDQIEREIKSNATPYSAEFEDDYLGIYGSGILNLSNYYTGDTPSTPSPAATPTVTPAVPATPTPAPPLTELISNVRYEDNGVIYAVIENKNGILTGSAEAIAVGYKNGLPEEVRSMSVATEGEETVFNRYLPNAEQFEYIKLFIWDSIGGMKPLSLPKTVGVEKTAGGEYIVQTIKE